MKNKDLMKQWTQIVKQLSMLTQFGLSLLTPTLLCLGICYLLTVKVHAGGWVYIPGFFFGLGGSAMVAWKFYLRTIKDEAKEEHRRGKKTSFNRHD